MSAIVGRLGVLVAVLRSAGDQPAKSLSGSPSTMPLGVILNSRTSGSCLLARVLSTVTARRSCVSRGTNYSRMTLSERWEMSSSARREMPNSPGTLLTASSVRPVRALTIATAPATGEADFPD